jgi:hypothetical protein
MSVSRRIQAGFVFVAVVGVVALLRFASNPQAGAETLQPAGLVKELSDSERAKSMVVYVGPASLYRGGHIPGAVFHGQAGNPAGLRELRAWAQNLPRTQPMVIYCGCCPWDVRPNVRPALTTLREMGFKLLRVLQIPTDFRTDWAQKGYPVEK